MRIFAILRELNQIIMIEFTQKILKAVSFDKQLFQKELIKALKWITDAEEVKKFQEYIAAVSEWLEN